MVHIAVFRAAYANSEEVESLVLDRLQLVDIEGLLLKKTAERFDVSEDKLLRAMRGPEFVFNKFTRRRELYLAQVTKVLSELIEDDNLLLCGFAAQLIPRALSHVLRVCILDDPEIRARAAARAKQIPEREAKKSVREEDKRCALWTDYLFGVSPWDRTLYDLRIPALTLGTSQAADLISDAAARLTDISPETIDRSVKDFQTNQTAVLALADAGLFHRVSCAAGVLTVTVNEYVVFFERLEEEIRRIVEKISNVKDVKVIAGPHFRPPTMFAETDFSLPQKVLLVDDERDFVLTLSERLEMRDASPCVAFTGEEALTMAAEEAPDVMILDLKMPGIDGMEVLRRVKAEHPEVEVIILTGHGSAEDKAQCLALGAFAYLEKPVNIDVLAETMRRAEHAGATGQKQNN